MNDTAWLIIGMAALVIIGLTAVLAMSAGRAPGQGTSHEPTPGRDPFAFVSAQKRTTCGPHIEGEPPCPVCGWHQLG